MAEKTKNLCAQIPESLHDTVRTQQQESGKTLSEYITEILTNYYENKKGMTSMENTKTLAVQLDAELFERFDEFLKKNHYKKRLFISNLIRKVLEEAEQEETSEDGASTAADAE